MDKNLELSAGQKVYFSSVLDDASNMNFSSSFAGENVTIVVSDTGSSPNNSEREFAFAKRIDVFDIKDDLKFCINYHHSYSIHDNGGAFEVVLSGECSTARLDELLGKINDNKIRLARENAPGVKKVVARAVSTISKMTTGGRK